jgi:hypothetical protein
VTLNKEATDRKFEDTKRVIRKRTDNITTKKKRKMENQRSKKIITQKTKDRATPTPLKSC